MRGGRGPPHRNERLRDVFAFCVRSSKLWDKQVVNLQVTDATEQTMQLRALVTAATAGDAFDLRCEVREKLIAFLQAHHPHALPRRRAELVADERPAAERAAAALAS